MTVQVPLLSYGRCTAMPAVQSSGPSTARRVSVRACGADLGALAGSGVKSYASGSSPGLAVGPEPGVPYGPGDSFPLTGADVLGAGAPSVPACFSAHPVSSAAATEITANAPVRRLPVACAISWTPVPPNRQVP
ncbi:hypothetical protein [Streptomyces sp. NBC_01104]|uniref:hypothetical protein n=1 Tax=Streptomyces sp. NBC_01104 TaxID=2903750 RepID=UPI0038662952|nr:hypothetical protein OG450_33105 [Streptomyces sp. NBC_01104]